MQLLLNSIFNNVLRFGLSRLSAHLGRMPLKLNRLRILLAERDKNATWLAKQVGRNKTAVARWCNNETQPHVATLYDIAEVLDVGVHEILVNRRPVATVNEKD